MLGYEWKKMLLCRGGWLLVAGLLLTELLLLLFIQPYDRELEHNRAAYGQYLVQVEGPLTAEKRDFLESEMTRLEQNRIRMENLKDDYYNARITEAEFRSGFAEYAPGEAVYLGFTKLFAQYIFVREDPARYFLYTGGWEVLLTDWTPDLLLLLVLVLLLTPVFCEEYASGMDRLLLTQKASVRWAVTAKVSAALLLTALLAAAVQLFELVHCAAVYGLPHGDYSLRSLRTFGATTGKVTLWQAFWLQFGLRELGYLYAAVLVLFLSVLLKKVSLSMMTGISLLILPHLAVPQTAQLLPLPGPWALAVGSIYLQSDDAQRLVPGVVLWSAGLMLGMLWTLRRRNTNWQLKWKPLLLLGCTALLTGCQDRAEPEICFNSVSARTYETERYRIEAEPFAFDSFLLDKATGESRPFPLDALNGQTVSCGGHLFGQGDTLYYIKTTTVYTTPMADSSRTAYDTLVKLDLNTLQEQVLYRWNRDTQWFFGLLERPSWEPWVYQLLFLHGNWLYFDDNSTICRMDLRTGAWEVFSDDRGSVDVAYDGTYFYYLDQYNRLNRQNLDTGQLQLVEDVVAGKFLLTPQGFFFLNRQDGQALWLWEPESGKSRKISDLRAKELQWQEGQLVLSTWEDQYYFLDPSGQLQRCEDQHKD